MTATGAKWASLVYSVSLHRAPAAPDHVWQRLLMIFRYRLEHGRELLKRFFHETSIVAATTTGYNFPLEAIADSNSYLGGDPTAQLSNQFPINSLASQKSGWRSLLMKLKRHNP